MSKVLEIEKDKMINIMTRLEFFENFSKLELQRLLVHNSQFILFEKGEKIIEKDKCDCAFFIILEGLVFIVSENKILTKVEAGQFFGEIAFLTKEPRTANAVAGQDTLLLKIDEHLMDHLHVKVKEKIKDKIIEKLIDNLKDMNKKLDSLK